METSNEPTILTSKRIGNRLFIFTSCHRMPSRSILVNGKPVICYRCGGINLGFIIAMLTQFIAVLFTPYTIDWFFGMESNLTLESIGYRFIFALLLQFPFIMDGSLQAIIRKYESKNPIRLITGTLGGIGQFYLVFSLGRLVKYFLT